MLFVMVKPRVGHFDDYLALFPCMFEHCCVRFYSSTYWFSNKECEVKAEPYADILGCILQYFVL